MMSRTRQFIYHIFVITAVLLMVSCRSTKDVSSLQKIYHTNLTSKVKVAVEMDGKSVSTNGTLRMRRDEVILLALVDPYLGAMEVGRMEFSKDKMLVIDRMGKRYIEESYATLSELTKENVSFEVIQDLFWREALNAGEKGTITYSFNVRTPVKLSLKLGALSDESDWEAHTDVSGKYTKVNAETLFKAFAQ